MDQLLKIGKWFWYAKEKMILGVLMAVFCWRVYQVVAAKPVDPTPDPDLIAPKADLSPEFAGPSFPTPPKPPAQPQNYSSLVSRNPWWLYGKQDVKDPTDPQSEEISLKRIVKWRDGTYRAEVYTRTAKAQRVKEGEQFENFILRKIDPGANTAEVYSEKSGKTISLKAQQQ